MSIASRGIVSKKADPDVKRLRVLSCFGNSEIKPCEFLTKSINYEGYHCGKCGCGDKQYTQLLSNSDTYSKLDYPYLTCPLKMPGFSNYDSSSPRDAEDHTRKFIIENYDISKLQEITVSNPEPNVEEYLLFKKLSRINENSIPK